MKKQLTTQECTALAIQHKSERDGRIRDRIKAVLLYDKGYKSGTTCIAGSLK